MHERKSTLKQSLKSGPTETLITFSNLHLQMMYTYICVLWIPIPQKIANASTKFSSFFVKCRSSNLLMSWKKYRTFSIQFNQLKSAYLRTDMLLTVSVKMRLLPWKYTCKFSYLNYTNDLPWGVLDRHTQDRLVAKAWAFINRRIKPLIFISIWNIYCLK